MCVGLRLFRRGLVQPKWWWGAGPRPQGSAALERMERAGTGEPDRLWNVKGLENPKKLLGKNLQEVQGRPRTGAHGHKEISSGFFILRDAVLWDEKPK